MKALGIILTIVLIAVSGLFIALVLMQSAKSDGVAGIGSGAETFYSQNKNASKEEKLNKLIKILAIVFVVICVILVLLQQFV